MPGFVPLLVTAFGLGFAFGGMGVAVPAYATAYVEHDPESVGGLLLGVIEALGAVFISSAYRDLYGFVLLILVLVLRPTGLFGERERTV